MDGVEEGAGEVSGGEMGVGADSVFEVVAREELSGGVEGVHHAIGEEDHDVVRLDREGDFVISGVVEHSEGESGGFDDGGLAGAAEDRAGPAGVGEAHLAAACVPGGVHHRAELRLEFALVQCGVEAFQHFRGAQFFAGDRAQES